MERKLHLFWPLALIAAGVIWILIEVGSIPAANLWALAYVWPLLLIGAGVSLILRPYWRFASPVISAGVVAVLFLSVLLAGPLGWNHVPSLGISNGTFFGLSTERGSGKVITQSRDVKGFTSVDLAYPASVVIRQGATESFSIEAEDNVVAALRTEVVNGALRIDNLRDHRVYVNPTKPVKITITAKELRDVRFDAAGDLTIQGLNGKDFRVELNGAGSINLSNATLQSLTATLDGAGSLHATGTADTLKVSLDGLGSFDGANLRSQKVSVTVNGMGSADVWAESNLSATINGLGSVNYYGSPSVSQSVNGLGSVSSKGAK